MPDARLERCRAAYREPEDVPSRSRARFDPSYSAALYGAPLVNGWQPAGKTEVVTDGWKNDFDRHTGLLVSFYGNKRLFRVLSARCQPMGHATLFLDRPLQRDLENNTMIRIEADA